MTDRGKDEIIHLKMGLITTMSMTSGKDLDIQPMSIACKSCLLKTPLKKLTQQPMITGIQPNMTVNLIKEEQQETRNLLESETNFGTLCSEQ